jgi:hypothetical protein
MRWAFATPFLDVQEDAISTRRRPRKPRESGGLDYPLLPITSQMHTAYAIGRSAFCITSSDGGWPADAEMLLSQLLTGAKTCKLRPGYFSWRLAQQVQENPALRQVLESNPSWPVNAQQLLGIAGGPEFTRTFQVSWRKMAPELGRV